MDSQTYYAALAALDWQVELGATDAICDQPVDRYALASAPKPAAKTAAPEPAKPVEVDPVAVARAMAAAAQDLAGLKTAMSQYTHCELHKGARNLVFADGVPGAPVMIIGEAPGRDEDREARPFVGRAGLLLDKMMAAINLSRQDNLYITNILPWRPPQNRDPRPEEIAMMLPFVERHIALAKPKLIVLMGNIACRAMLGRTGITRLRGNWEQVADRPTMPMFHPAYLLRNPAAKRLAWQDLLDTRARLESLP